MATEAIIRFGRLHAAKFVGPVLEVGSLIQPSYDQKSPRCIQESTDDVEWVGIDIEDGQGVDYVADLSVPGVAAAHGWTGTFRTVHCHCVMEHVRDPFALARGIQDCLHPEGVLFISVPFSWKVHRIPVDMWRFTPQSIDYLFPCVEFDPASCAFSTRAADRFHPVEAPPELHLGSRIGENGRVFGFALRLARKLRVEGGVLSGQRALMLESNLMMIGRKVSGPAFTFLVIGQHTVDSAVEE